LNCILQRQRHQTRYNGRGRTLRSRKGRQVVVEGLDEADLRTRKPDKSLQGAPRLARLATDNPKRFSSFRPGSRRRSEDFRDQTNVLLEIFSKRSACAEGRTALLTRLRLLKAIWRSLFDLWKTNGGVASLTISSTISGGREEKDCGRTKGRRTDVQDVEEATRTAIVLEDCEER
jgi:hypothetical protein